MVKAQRHAKADLAHDGTSGDWYFDVTKSGGYLIEQSVHNLDLCNWAIGAHPTRACGFGATVCTRTILRDAPSSTAAASPTIIPAESKCRSRKTCFIPRSMPNGNQYVYVYGTKGAVDLMTGDQDPGRGSQPVILAPDQQEDQFAHIAAFYDSIAKVTPPPVDIKGGATAALTAILGHQAMVQEKVVNWSDFGIEFEAGRTDGVLQGEQSNAGGEVACPGDVCRADMDRRRCRPEPLRRRHEQNGVDGVQSGHAVDRATFANPPAADWPWVRLNMPATADPAEIQAEVQQMHDQGSPASRSARAPFPTTINWSRC